MASVTVKDKNGEYKAITVTDDTEALVLTYQEFIKELQYIRRILNR